MASPMWRSGIIAMSAGVLILAAPALTSAPSNERAESLGDGDLGRLSAADLLPLHETSTALRFIEGERDGEAAVQRLSRHHNGAWVLEVPDHHRTVVAENQSGDIVLLGEELPSEGYAFRYDPPPIIIPATIQPGYRHRQSGQIRIYSLENGGDLEHTSRYEHTVSIRGIRGVPSASGRTRAVVIRTERSADLGEAEVSTEIEDAYEPGTGRIYQRTVTDASGGPFNLWSETTVHTLRRSEEAEVSGR